MSFFLCMVKALIPIISMIGISLVIYDRLRIDPAFLPIWSVSFVTLFLYAGGIFGVLPWAAILLCVLGIAAALYSAVRIWKKAYSVRPLLTSPALIFFALSVLYFMIQMRGHVCLHVDNYSHWATVIKEICVTDAFPADPSAIICRNYTPGSAAFIYYICKFTGYTEGIALAAQGIILASALCVIFCKASFKKPFTLVCLFITAIVTVSVPELLSASLHIYNFLVDGLISFITAAAGIIAYRYRDDLYRLLWVLIPVTSMLTLIKSSARIFAALVGVMVILLFAKKIFRMIKTAPRSAVLHGVGIVSLFIAQVIIPSTYNMYITRAFPGSTMSDNKFPSDVRGLLSVFSEKDPAYLKNIGDMMWTEMTNLTSLSLRIFIVAEVFALIVLFAVLISKKSASLIGKTLIASNLTALFYVAELYILYAFIFDESEATILASFYRYFFTGAVLVAVVLFTGGIYALQNIPLTTAKKIAAPLLCGVMVFGVYTARENIYQLADPLYRTETAERYERRVEYLELYSEASEHIPPNSDVMIYINTKNYFLRILPQYELLPVYYTLVGDDSFSDADSMKERIERVDYIVIAGEGETFIRNMNSLGYRDLGDGTALVYQVTHTADGASVPVPVG